MLGDPSGAGRFSGSVLELGAAAALPSMVAALNGARKVVVTDYPDPELVENIVYNVDHNLPGMRSAGRVIVQVRLAPACRRSQAPEAHAGDAARTRGASAAPGLPGLSMGPAARAAPRCPGGAGLA